MPKLYSQIIIFLLILTLSFSQKSKFKKKPLKTTFNSTNKFSSTLKFHSKILQTVYSDSFSRNYFYTTLYVGDQKVKQKYLLDTGSSIMSSPCSPCPKCGSHKNNYFYDFNRYHKPLECKSNICKLVPANNCKKKNDKNKNSCSFNYDYNNDDDGNKNGIEGYYLRDVVYFETSKSKNIFIYKKNAYLYDNSKLIFRSYAIPIGCTNAEFGEYRNLKTDGIMGLNNSPKSFISVLYNLKIIPENKFSLCFSLRGGYMSLGEINYSYHKKDFIDYVPLLESEDSYLININGLSLNNNENFISGKHIASIETRHSKSYFPQFIYKSIIKEFDEYCSKKNYTCGKFDYHAEGYCAVFNNRSSLFRSLYHWPNITLHLDDSEYTWRPFNYYYYSYNELEYKACLGFDGHKLENIILGSNFINMYDIIFDREYQRLGFVPADCSRENMIWKRLFLNKSLEFMSDPNLMDLEIHKNNEFKLGDNTNKEIIEFLEGHNTELETNEFQTFNFIIFLVSMIIVGIFVGVILFVLFCNKKGGLKYEPREEVEYNIEQKNESNDNSNEENNENQSGDNKISFEESIDNNISINEEYKKK